MQIRILIPFIILCILSCSQSEKNNLEKEKIAKKVSISEVELIEETTAMGIIPVSEFPKPFYGDTTYPIFPKRKVLLYQMEDSIQFNYDFNAWYPQSGEMKEIGFNDAIKKLINNYFYQFKLERNESTGGTYVNAEIIASDFISIPFKYSGVLFNEQSYVDGAAHYNHGYLSYHHDFFRGKEIRLTDILIFKPGEAQKFCDAFNPDPTSEIAEVVLVGEDFSAERPFMVSYGELYLYFSDYEKGPSMTRITIPYAKFKGYVNPEYRYLFEN